MFRSFVRRSSAAVDAVPLPEGVKVAIGVSIIIGLSAYPVLKGAPQKAGHDLASSEKPQAFRGERERNLEDEKKIAAERRAAKAAAKAAAASAAPSAAAEAR